MTTKKTGFLILTITLLLVTACQHQNLPVKISLEGEAQGTYYAVSYYDVDNRNFQAQIDSLLHAFDLSVSLWVPGSIISRVNSGDTTVELDDIFRYNFLLSKEIAAATNGAFDFTIEPLVTAWGFGLREMDTVDSRLIDSLKHLVDFRKVMLSDGRVVKEDPRISFNFNAIAQGHSVDLISDFLSNQGIKSFIVDVGGEVYARDLKADSTEWRVGIEKPAEEKTELQVIQMVVALHNKGLSTSGSYRKYHEVDGVRYSHTIDPETGYPVNHNLLSVTVMAANTAVADGYSTAFMVMGVEKSMKLMKTLPDMEALFISAKPEGGFEIEMTPGFREMIRD